MLKYDVGGRFIEPVAETLRADPSLPRDIATDLLDAHFPATAHDDILAAVGIDPGVVVAHRRPRDPEFRLRVLTYFEHRCVACDGVGLDGTLIGIKVAHNNCTRPAAGIRIAACDLRVAR